MKSRNLLNLVLLGIVVVLVLIVVFEPGKKPVQPKPKLTTLNKDSVSKIKIQRLGKKDVLLEKQHDEWHMMAPYQLPANKFRLEAILRLLETPSYSQHDIRKLDKHTFKLDKPEITLTFDNKLSMAFGGSEPLNHRRYVQVGDTLNLISDSVYYYLAGKTTSLLSLQLLPANSAIKAIQLPKYKLQLKAGHWQIENEPKKMASDAVTQLLNNWKLAQALDVVPATAKPGKQQVKIFFEGQEKPIVFSIVKRQPDFILLREDKGVEYQLTEDSADRLLTLAGPETTSEPGNKSDDKTAKHTTGAVTK